MLKKTLKVAAACCAALLILLLAGGPALCQLPLENEFRLFPDDPLADSDDWFGYFTALSGDRMLVGSIRDEAVGSGEIEEGAAYFYRWDGAAWTGEQRVKPHDQEECTFLCDIFFGACGGIDGDVAVVGAPFAEYKPDPSILWPGGAYIYRHNGVEWIFEEKVHGVDPGTGDPPAAWDLFAGSIAISCDLIIAGAPWRASIKGTMSGAAYIYRYDPAALPEEEKWKLDGDSGHLIDEDGAPYDAAGGGVDIYSGDGVELAIVSSPRDYDDLGRETGSAVVYRYDPIGQTWNQDGAKLRSIEPDVCRRMGWSVAITENLAVVGAGSTDGATGAVYVFRYDPASPDKWVQVDKLEAFDKEPGSCFGEVAISGDMIVVGGDCNSPSCTKGSSYLCHPVGPDDWDCATSLLPPDAVPGDTFSHVSIDGNRIAVGGKCDEYGDEWWAGSVQVWKIPEAPQDPVEALLDLLTALGDTGLLNQGQETSFTNLIENAVRQYVERGNLNGACSLLENFIRQVEKLVEQGVLSPEEGQELIDYAQALMDEYGC